MVVRSPNTTTAGRPFDQSTINALWQKAQVIPGYDPGAYRKDRCGAWIQKSAHGTTGDYGWDIDHAIPVAKGGTDDINNLQPLHWKNNRHKSDDYPNWTCAVVASSN